MNYGNKFFICENMHIFGYLGDGEEGGGGGGRHQ